MGARIGFITHSLGGGGAERVTALLANGLARLGNTVTLLTLTDLPHEKEYPLADTITVKRAGLSDGSHLGFIIRRRNTINCYLAETDPDVVVALNGAHQADYLGTNLLSSVPFIASKRNFEPKADDLRGRVMQGVERHVFRHAKGVVFQTPDQMNLFEASIRSKATIIENPVDLNGLPRASRTGNKIVSAGRLVNQKRFDVLINAFSQVAELYPGYVLVIYGDGPLRDSLQRLANDRGVSGRVIIRGFSRNVHKEIADAKLFVSSSDYEGISNSLIEALGMGMPVVATDCDGGGSRFALAQGGGILVQKDNPQAMADKICRVLADRNLQNELSASALDSVKRFELSAVCNKWMNYIYRIIG